MIELQQLSKRYGPTSAVEALDLRIEPGEVFGFLGPNGAGKTTTIKMMMGLLRPTSGRVVLGGFDLQTHPLPAKQLCGFVPDRPHLYEKLSGRELIDFVAGLYGVPDSISKRRAPRLLEMFDLAAWGNELIESYSHGMKQRLVMAAALVHSPRILIVDEPMVGMDPHGAQLLKRTFRDLAGDGVTVFLSTHSLDVAEETCDRIGIIHRGRLQALGSIDDLRATAGLHGAASLESVFLQLTRGSEARPTLADLDA